MNTNEFINKYTNLPRSSLQNLHILLPSPIDQAYPFIIFQVSSEVLVLFVTDHEVEPKSWGNARLNPALNSVWNIKNQTDHLIQCSGVVYDGSGGGAEILEKRPTKQLIKVNLTPRQNFWYRLRQIAEIIHEVGEILENQPTKHLIKP